jgi:ADP-ribosylglycohydrolase/tyrosine-protein phosphatase YwqE
MENPMNNENTWLSGIMGLVVGDALGVPVQFMKREEIKNRPAGPVTGMESGGVYDMPKGTWSDDSSMALATLAAYLESGILAPEEVMVKFCLWEVKGEFTPFGEAFDEGNTCSGAIYDFLENLDASTCGKTGEYANGNGALMRILPACLYYYEVQKKFPADMTGDVIRGIDAISALTHNHLRSKMACGLYYFMVREILDAASLEQKSGLLDILQKGIDVGLRFYGSNVSNLTEMTYFGRLFHLEELRELTEDDINSSGYVIDSIEAAVWCLITTDTFRDCLLKAVNLGDDSDTVAAIAGGLAGLYYGYENIPEEWLCEIQKRDWIEEMCAKADDGEDEPEVFVCDIHMHVIPSVDDGSESMEMSLAMLRSAYIQGVRTVLCTSHGGVYFDEEHSDKAWDGFDELEERCQAEIPDMHLYLGAEVRMLPQYIDRIIEALNDGSMPTMADSEYVLAEYVNHGMTFSQMQMTLERLKKEGYIPIIAHMERYFDLVPDIKAAKMLHDSGCYIQINAYSLTDGETGKIRKRAKALLDAGIVDFIGSDAHRTYHRPPNISRGIRALYENYDKEYVDRMVYRNVEDLILGEDI